MGKCAYCGKNFEGSNTFCSTKCGVEYNEKKTEGKIDDSSGEWWLLSIIFKNWKIVLLFFIVVYVIDFFSGSKKSDNRLYQTTDTTGTSTNTDISEKISEPEPEKEVTESEIIKDLKENQIANILNGSTNLKYEVLNGDLNNDGNLDCIVTYCIEATDEDRNAGGGNALANMTCVNEGMVIYLVKPKTGTSFSSIHYNSDEFYNLKEYVKPNTISFYMNRIKDDGTIVCNTTGYKDDDARCCPTDESEINIKLISNSDGTVRFEKE